jgi:hypothetical protein
VHGVADGRHRPPPGVACTTGVVVTDLITLLRQRRDEARASSELLDSLLAQDPPSQRAPALRPLRGNHAIALCQNLPNTEDAV